MHYLIQRIHNKQRFTENIRKFLQNLLSQTNQYCLSNYQAQELQIAGLQSTHDTQLPNLQQTQKPQTFDTESQRLLPSEPATRTTLTRDVLRPSALPSYNEVLCSCN